MKRFNLYLNTFKTVKSRLNINDYRLLSTKVEPDKKTFYVIDILADHGGKIALAGFLFSAGLIYRYVKSGSNRTSVEKALTNAAALEPIEVNEIRFANYISSAQFESLVTASRSNFPNGCSYNEFIDFCKQHLKTNITLGHLLDRVIYFRINEMKPKDADEETTADETIKLNVPFPIDYLLIVFSMSVQCTPEERVTLLYKMGLKNSSVESSNEEEIPSWSSSGISLTEAEAVVDHLIRSYQIPAEKRVVETGVNWPVKTYREKNAFEMINEFRASRKPPHERDDLTEEEFTSAVLGRFVCAWGECHR